MMCRKALLGAVLASSAIAGSMAQADVKLPAVFSSHMVLQQQKPITVWGWATAGEGVTVKLGNNTQQTKASDAGEWRVSLPALAAGGPYTMTISGTNTLTLDDVLVGEVWLCSGQSNMEMGIGAADNGEKEIAAADHPNIRLMMVPKTIAGIPQNNVDAKWVVCAPDTVKQNGWSGFSAAGYYFGRELNKQLSVPIGLIDSSWGGTRIEPWTPAEAFNQIPSLKGIYDQVLLADPRTEAHKTKLSSYLASLTQWMEQARTSMKDNAATPAMPAFPADLNFKSDPQTPTGLYNGMINPLVPFAIRGAIWYQGESNHYEGKLYVDKTKALVDGWRKVWNDASLPYYFVQIAPYEYGDESPTMLPEFWEAQASVVDAIPNAGMVVTTDIGNIKDIHPKNKQEVGRRLALCALAKTYGKSDVVYSGPTFKSLKADGKALQVTFANVGGGLVSRDGKPLSYFEIIDKDNGGFVAANAKIIAPDTVLLTADGVQNPVAVRFGWNKIAEPNLSNKEGLPAPAFRAGEVPKRDALSMVNESRSFKLVYDLDLSKLAHDITYDVDNHGSITGTISRIAYFVELGTADGKTQWVWVSVDPFTKDITKIGIPTIAAGATFQQMLANMNVASNVPGIVTGEKIRTGNIEFWSSNYGQNNSAKVPNASSDVFDFGDQPTDPADGYGCMQIHNYGAKQTIFAINHWAAASTADLGIGNRQGQDVGTDWTFANNAGSYTSKRLRVLVETK